MTINQTINFDAALRIDVGGDGNKQYTNDMA